MPGTCCSQPQCTVLNEATLQVMKNAALAEAEQSLPKGAVAVGKSCSSGRLGRLPSVFTELTRPNPYLRQASPQPRPPWTWSLSSPSRL